MIFNESLFAFQLVSLLKKLHCIYFKEPNGKKNEIWILDVRWIEPTVNPRFSVRLRSDLPNLTPDPRFSNVISLGFISLNSSCWITILSFEMRHGITYWFIFECQNLEKKVKILKLHIFLLFWIISNLIFFGNVWISLLLNLNRIIAETTFLTQVVCI